MNRKKILLVDDSTTVLMLHRMMLSERNYELCVARNGPEALEKAARERPDLIFMDVMMPEMDGYEVCRRLRSTQVTQKTPIIMVTGRSDPANVERGFQSGCNAYMTKPFSSAELISKLKEFLGE